MSTRLQIMCRGGSWPTAHLRVAVARATAAHSAGGPRLVKHGAGRRHGVHVAWDACMCPPRRQPSDRASTAVLYGIARLVFHASWAQQQDSGMTTGTGTNAEVGNSTAVRGTSSRACPCARTMLNNRNRLGADEIGAEGKSGDLRVGVIVMAGAPTIGASRAGAAAGGHAGHAGGGVLLLQLRLAHVLPLGQRHVQRLALHHHASDASARGIKAHAQLQHEYSENGRMSAWHADATTTKPTGGCYVYHKTACKSFLEQTAPVSDQVVGGSHHEHLAVALGDGAGGLLGGGVAHEPESLALARLVLHHLCHTTRPLTSCAR